MGCGTAPGRFDRQACDEILCARQPPFNLTTTSTPSLDYGPRNISIVITPLLPLENLPQSKTSASTPNSIVQRGSLGGEQRHCSSVLIEFDSTTGGGKRNVLLLSFKTERGPFSVPHLLPPPPTTTQLCLLSFPSIISPLFFFSPRNEKDRSFLWSTSSPEITLRFTELIPGMTTDQ
ncbi:unnamed protein product [Pleuronectes platessa]|uniref:Uncharacterized protein n=1 Tax=Pleuronectes platessa TaxID=8262 RepID=A0A9N7TME3_PLEPL|nr:unnamed protein product [Pleuronectes platessa]